MKTGRQDVIRVPDSIPMESIERSTLTSSEELADDTMRVEIVVKGVVQT